MLRYIVVIIACLSWNVRGSFLNEVTPICRPEERVCRFDLVVARNQTMVLFNGANNAQPLFVENNTIFKRSCESGDNGRIPITDSSDLENVFVGDGNQQYIYTINGQFPGPTIVVYEGQQVHINVTNKLMQEGVGIHWHGIVQKGTFFMDGVPGVTQCSIEPQNSFLYQFIAEPKGSHWYHSHLGAQRSDGMFGAFIVLPKPGDKTDSPDRDFAKDYVMMVEDWFQEESHLLYTSYYSGLSSYFNQDISEGKACYGGTALADGAGVGPLPYHSGLVNGKGFFGSTFDTDVIEEYVVDEGQYYRFRVMNMGMMFALRVSIDGHKLHVISSDGYDIDEVEVDYVIVAIAERYDFYIRADQPSANYWIRAETLEESEDHSMSAVLHYSTIIRGRPTSRPHRCSLQQPCRVLNCPFRDYPSNKNMTCINVGDLRSTAALPQEDIEEERFLIFNFAPESFSGRSRSSVNGIVFQAPSQLVENFETTNFARRCDPESCQQEPCVCTHVQQFQTNQWVQMVVINYVQGAGAGAAHPVHIHGRHFRVVKVGYPQYDSNSKFTGLSTDVTCHNNETTFCRFPHWSDSSWSKDNVPGLNLNRPVFKDTVQIPPGGYVVIRFKTDNPGRWMMHCHMEIHQIEGMALIIQEGTDDEIPPHPDNAPRCGSFQSLSREGSSAACSGQCKTWRTLFIVACSIAGFILIIFIIYVGCNCSRKGSESRNKSPSRSPYPEYGAATEKSHLLGKDNDTTT